MSPLPEIQTKRPELQGSPRRKVWKTPTAKRQVPISVVARKIKEAEAKARQMVKNLEIALVRTGYTRRAQYRQHFRGKVSACLLWDGKRIALLSVKDKKRAFLFVDELSGDDLVTLAQHLGPLLDEMEASTRHHLNELMGSLDQLSGLVTLISDDPRPHNEK